MSQSVQYDEKELLLEYQRKRQRYEDLKKLSGEAYRELEGTVRELVQYLEDTGKHSTAKYDGIGRVTLAKPTLSAKFDPDDAPRVFEYLREQGMSDAIKERIHHSTLSSYIAHQIQDGAPVPEFIKTSYKPNIRFQKQ